MADRFLILNKKKRLVNMIIYFPVLILFVWGKLCQLADEPSELSLCYIGLKDEMNVLKGIDVYKAGTLHLDFLFNPFRSRMIAGVFRLLLIVIITVNFIQFTLISRKRGRRSIRFSFIIFIGLLVYLS
jgi:hypothetical protein